MQPEKALVFGPILIFFLLFGALVIGFLAVLVKLVSKGKAMAWKGELIDKLHNTGQDADSDKVNHFYTLVFKTEDGKEVKVGTSKQVFDSYEIGAKAEKKAGELWPKKLD